MVFDLSALLTLNNAWNILRFLLGLSVLVFVHELGHFLAAKRAGIKVEEFGLGFPPRVLKKKFGETIYSLNLFPIGGFVRLYGEEEDVEKDKARAFYHKTPLVRAGVVVAGVVMNFLLAIVIFSVVSYTIGVPRDTGVVQIYGVAEGSPAKQVGVEAGDKVFSIAGNEVKTSKQFIAIVEKNRGKEVEMVLKSEDGVVRSVKVTPREKNPNDNEGALGVSMGDQELYIPEFPERIFLSIKHGALITWSWVLVTLDGLRTLVVQLTGGTLPKDLAGPVGIQQVENKAAKEGLISLLALWGILSVNLGILNIVPFPALDGGRFVFIVAEAIFGRRIRPKVEYVINMTGLGLLLLFLVLVTRQDISRLVGGY